MALLVGVAVIVTLVRQLHLDRFRDSHLVVAPCLLRQEHRHRGHHLFGLFLQLRELEVFFGAGGMRHVHIVNLVGAHQIWWLVGHVARGRTLRLILVCAAAGNHFLFVLRFCDPTLFSIDGFF